MPTSLKHGFHAWEKQIKVSKAFGSFFFKISLSSKTLCLKESISDNVQCFVCSYMPKAILHCNNNFIQNVLEKAILL
jgi:hypothetical protein